MKRDERQIAWALYRDGELYMAFPEEADAEKQREQFEPGSKHEWVVVRIKYELA